MQFPKRTNEHIKESLSWRIFENKVPNEWIIRDVTERDYGIDAYLEIVSANGYVTGDLCSIQIKATENIKLLTKGLKRKFTHHYPGIKKETVNYWMSLPVPVFIVLVDTTKKRVLYAPVKQQVRRQYNTYINPNQKSMGFDFAGGRELGAGAGTLLFFSDYFYEKKI